MKRFAGIGVGIGAMITATAGSAKEPAPELAACVADANNGQALRQAGRMVDARSTFDRCAKPVCPTVVRNECATWARDVAREIGKLEVRVTDANGAVVDADVSVDAVHVDARDIDTDPGPHIIRARVGNAQVESSVIVARGERRKVELVVPQTSPPSPPPSAASTPPAAPLRFTAPVVVGLGLGAASLAAGAAFGIMAGNRVDDLARDCAPRCALEDVRGAKTTAFVADVFFVTGAVALLASGLLFVLDNQSRRDAQLGQTQIRSSRWYGAH